MKLEIIQNNYLYVPGFILPETAASLSCEFKDHASKFYLQGDPQAPNSQSMYNFMPFVRLLVNKVPHVSELLGEEVLPTYSYARIYQNDSKLSRHRDRPACEISLTINLSKDTEWPIFFERPDKSETSIELEPGDAVLYLGCQADHWRNSFNGKEYTQLFMHYVKSYGSKSWAYFDKNQQQKPTLALDVIPVSIV